MRAPIAVGAIAGVAFAAVAIDAQRGAVNDGPRGTDAITFVPAPAAVVRVRQEPVLVVTALAHAIAAEPTGKLVAVGAGATLHASPVSARATSASSEAR